MTTAESRGDTSHDRIDRLGSVIAFLTFERMIILQHRDYLTQHSPGMLTGWGGAIERIDVTPEAAMDRELNEEVSDLRLAQPLKRFGAVSLEQRTYCMANGPMYLFHAPLSSPNFQVLEGQGSIAVPLAGVERWEHPGIVPDALLGIQLLKDYIGE